MDPYIALSPFIGWLLHFMQGSRTKVHNCLARHFESGKGMSNS